MTAATDYARALNGRAGDSETGAELSLMGFGFTEMESKLYCELLRSGPASGYRLAQRISKAAANVYQALKTLAQKGAITASEGIGADIRLVAMRSDPSDPLQILTLQQSRPLGLDQILHAKADDPGTCETPLDKAND